MIRTIIFLLYCLAILTGVTGLLAGGIPLVTYALARWHSPAFDFTSNFGFIATAFSMVILSIMLLIVVHISHVVGGGFPINRNKPVSRDKLPPDSPPPTAPPPAVTPKAPADEESADAKLSRLLNQKNFPDK